jgi:hypothetical protein
MAMKVENICVEYSKRLLEIGLGIECVVEDLESSECIGDLTKGQFIYCVEIARTAPIVWCIDIHIVS